MPQKPSIAARVSTGLKDPIQVVAADLDSPVPTLISEHVKDQWHRRVMPDRTRNEALVGLVEIFESGTEVRTRRSPYRWVRSMRNNSLYFAIGHDIILPAEPVRGSSEVLELTTCMTNPECRRPINVGNQRGSCRNAKARKRR